MTTTILGIGGSLREGSTTSLGLRAALAGAEEAGARIEHFDLADCPLPLFDSTYSLAGYTDAERFAVEALFELVMEADGFIFASPTYHNTMSGAFKNALDLLDVLAEQQPDAVHGKVAGILTVQGGTSGTGVNTLTSMLLAARSMGLWVAPTMVSIPGSRKAFGADGMPVNLSIEKRLHTLGEEVTQASRMFASYGG